MADRTRDTQYLGDIVERLAQVTGMEKVAQVVEKVTKKPCGCAERKRKMNEWHQRLLEKRHELAK